MTRTTPAQPAVAPEDETAVTVQNLSKLYKVYSNPRDLAVELFTGKVRHREHWALRDMSFTVARGQVVGILGPNGAGKSTLLKIIVGTLAPTSGKVVVNGRVSAILELGTGFHPEYSGRDNVVTGGICLGMTRAEIEAKLPWIVEFSELGDVIDLPFKTYSSGMRARLTFATAISVEPDILVIDEALAAGDSYFINKCMERIKQICRSGATVLFVTHAPNLVAELCDWALWIDSGMIKSMGAPLKVAKEYEQSVMAATERRAKAHTADAHRKSREHTQALYTVERSSLHVERVAIFDQSGQERHAFRTGEQVTFKIWWCGRTDKGNIGIGLRVDGPRLLGVSGYASWEEGFYLNGGNALDGRGCVALTIPRAEFGAGEYYVSVSLQEPVAVHSTATALYYADRIASFSMHRRELQPYTFIYEPKFAVSEVAS